jgi:hypothetical protein
LRPNNGMDKVGDVPPHNNADHAAYSGEHVLASMYVATSGRVTGLCLEGPQNTLAASTPAPAAMPSLR